MNRWLFWGVAGLIAIANPSQGFAALIGYEFSNTLAPTVEPGVFSSVSVLAKNTGTSPTGLNIFELFNGGPPTALRVSPNSTVVGATLTTAFNNGWYFDFSFAVAPDVMVDLTQLTFQATRGGASTGRGLGVTTSLTGHTQANTIISTSNVPTAHPDFTDYTVNLSTNPAFQGLSSEDGSVSFRFYIFTPGNTTAVNFDNILLSGNVTAVPEPSTFALLGVLGLGVVLQVVRRQIKSQV